MYLGPLKAAEQRQVRSDEPITARMVTLLLIKVVLEGF